MPTSGSLLVSSAKITQGNSGNAQTIGMRPEAAIIAGGTTAQNVIFRSRQRLRGGP